MLRRPKSRGSADRVPLRALFIGFLKVSLCGFGGGLVWARRVVVEQRRWMDDREFAETLTLCQLMPGPNIIGIAVCVGAKRRGAIGAVASAAGFILVPWTVGLSVGAVILRHAGLATPQKILAGISSAAAGLVIGTGLKLLRPHIGHRTAMLFAAAAFIALAGTRLPLPAVLLALAPLSIAVICLEGGRAR